MKYIDPKKICFKETVNGRIYEMREGGALWRKTFHYFQLHKEEFMDHYHKRSNAETVFAMMKRKFLVIIYTPSQKLARLMKSCVKHWLITSVF
ncbi:MAG: hypothetical protein KAU84_05030 [Thermoplasmatales archaeon]|nr:hypothetical protein [Thermoplasmatales archaeon]